MAQASNKNKNITNTLRFTGLALLVACFLAWPMYQLLAQVSGNTNNAANINAVNQAPVNSNTNTSSTQYSIDPNLGELNQAIDAKRQAIDELKKKTEIYQQTINTKQQEALTLQNQIALMDLQIQQAENDITTVQDESDKVGLEIQRLELAIAAKQQEVDDHTAILAEYLRMIYKYDQKTYLEILMSNTTFSEFFDRLQYTQELQGKVEKTLVSLKDDKQALDTQKTEQDNKKIELADLTEKLHNSVSALGQQKQYKSDLIIQTKDSEEKFTALLEQSKQEQLAAESDVNTLETKAREKLEQGGVNLNTNTALIWPVNPLKGISAYFHDTTYIFRKYFEHPAIDIPTPQGTAIRAADNGYIVRAKNAGLGYSYIMIVHNNAISTVYGHVSRIDVAEEQYVIRGQQIGLSGGTPGTSGAGSFTTGPHLHFEVRSGGIPVNPLDYLPAM